MKINYCLRDAQYSFKIRMLNMNLVHNQPEWLYVSLIVLGDDVMMMMK